MRIDGTSGPEPHGLPEGTSAPRGPKPRTGPKTHGPAPDDPQIRYLQEVYLEKVAAVEEVNHQSVAEARELLESGQLDTTQAIRRAAEAIARVGT